MSLSIVFAIASMFSAGLNDLVFKRYVSKERPKGIYVALIGLIWSGFYLILGTLSGGMHFDHNTVLYGLISGIAVIAANILLLEGFRGVDASVGSTIYRLHFVVVIVLAPLFLSEELTLGKIVGLLFAISSVLLMAQADHSQEHQNKAAPVFVLLVILASMLRGITGFFFKIATNHHVHEGTFLFVTALLWVIGGLLYWAIGERDIPMSGAVVPYGLVSGLLCVGIASFLLLSVKLGEAIMAVPIAQLSFVVTTALSIMLLKERVTRYKVLGGISAVGAIVSLAFASLH